MTIKNELIESQSWYSYGLSLIAAGKAALATDIDGTLSPIAPTPAAASVPVSCRAALSRLAKSGQLAVVAVVSGRTALETRQMVGLSELLYIGNHGLEILAPNTEIPVMVRSAKAYQPLITSVLETIEYRLATLTNSGSDKLSGQPSTGEANWVSKLVFENKGVAASIHYRLCPDPELARQLILKQVEEIARRAGLRVSEGRMVIELKPPGGISKGTALAEMVENYNLKSLIFLGDDLTDVEGFRALKHKERESLIPHRRLSGASPIFKSLAVGVRSSEMPSAVDEWADVLVDGVRGVDQFLSWLSQALTYQLTPQY